ncbi:glyoxalase [Agromyces intestinalis]|uniref:Glyoxalase n=2 Tax=Agromyces TaxID=33877 RepID=A0A5C1YII8_9MICO|nr:MULTISPECIES: VOC family protein [Agromyces]QEO15418.1 glyoxalase [Agromyces intestinalis]UOE45755.1 VOC family protein [Agromyces larvae]
MSFVRLHHSAFAHPVGAEDAARAFYVGVLGLVEVPKPETMDRSRGAWFRSEPDAVGGSSGIEIHAIPDPEFAPNAESHPAILVDDLDALAARFAEHGIAVEPDDRFPGHRRFHARDPFGNRLEFLEALR